MSNELKCCPFCGGKAEEYKRRCVYDGKLEDMVICSRCGTSTIKLWWNERNIIKNEDNSEAYNKGLDDAWELARKIVNMTHSDKDRILGTNSSCNGTINVMNDFTPQEALAKLEAYEKANEIKVGDIVKDGKNYFLVTKGYNNTFEGMSNEGYLYCGLSLRDCKKTGKHIDLTDIFKQIGGAE